MIIFMVAAPLATVDVPVDLPASTAKPQPKPETPLYVTLRSDGALLVGESETASESFAAALGAASGGDTGTQVFLRADKTVDYVV